MLNHIPIQENDQLGQDQRRPVSVRSRIGGVDARTLDTVDTASAPRAILLRSEGIASSGIEGEVAPTRRVFEAEYAPDDVSDRQAQRIVNSIHVMSDVIVDAGEGVTPQDINRWHALLFEGVPATFERGARAALDDLVGRGVLTLGHCAKRNEVGRPRSTRRQSCSHCWRSHTRIWRRQLSGIDCQPSGSAIPR